MIRIVTLLLFIAGCISFSTAEDCPLPTIAEIERELNLRLLPSNITGEGSQTFNSTVTEGSVQYVCQAQGSMIDTYQEVALVATFTTNPGEPERTRLFSLMCSSSGTWDSEAGSLATLNSVAPLRTDCSQCLKSYDRCRQCDSACYESGLMRCTGRHPTDCCLSFTVDGQCDGSTDCASSGPNYVATESNNYICTCNLTCPDGYAHNPNCTGCDFNSICDRDSPCMNGGQCIQYSPPDNYTCDCTGTGYEGDNCTVSPCDSNPCQNGGTCMNEETGYTCNCTEGFNETDCSNNIDDCSPDPCQNGATCMDLVADYTCNCTEGYTGKNCSNNTDECDPNPCENGATCMDLVADYTCYCTEGYTGKNCSIDIDKCDPNPCENGATCMDLVADYTCNCTEGYTGKNCSIDIDKCDPNPCENGATCMDLVADYTCYCTEGYTGANCSVNIDDCIPNPCKNGGTCIDGVASYSCQCQWSWVGDNCTTCSLDNCLNCSNTSDQCSTCIQGYLLRDNICTRDDCISDCDNENNEYQFRACQFYCSLERWRQVAMDHSLNVPAIKPRNKELSFEEQWREALQEQRKLQDFWLQEAQKRGLAVTEQTTSNSDDLQRDWYESLSDGIGYQQNWQNDAKSLRPSATVGDFNNINTNQPSGGADADELRTTYDEYMKNWHDDLMFYEEEF